MPRSMPKIKPRDLLKPLPREVPRGAAPRRAKERRSSFRSLPRMKTNLPRLTLRRAKERKGPKERRSSFRSLPRPLKPEARERKDPRNPTRERRKIGPPAGSFRSLPRPLPPPKPLPKLT